MAFFSFPRLTGFLSGDNRDTVGRWIIVQTALARIKAVQQNNPYLLQVDVSEDAFRVMPATLSSDPSPEAGQSIDDIEDMSPFDDLDGEASGEITGGVMERELVLSDNVDIIDVVFPDDTSITSGLADICFYGQGYSDRAMIHIKSGEDRFSFYIAPFLPQVKIYDGYVGFEGNML